MNKAKGITILLVVVVAASGCATGAATVVAVTPLVVAATPVVIAVIKYQLAKRGEEAEVSGDAFDDCPEDVARAQEASRRLLFEAGKIRREFREAGADIEPRFVWQDAFRTTREWYRDKYDEAPFALVVRLYECADKTPPEDPADDWTFYTELALRQLGYLDADIEALLN